MNRITWYLTAFILLSGAYIVHLVTPSTNAVRIRNSLIFEVSNEPEMTWLPNRAPESFKAESVDPPAAFTHAIQAVTSSSAKSNRGFSEAIAIGELLAVGPIIGGAIQSDTLTTFDTILREGTGYCADFTQVYNGLSYAAHIPVREWAMSFDGFGGSGHAFNEIYDFELAKWIFIDSFYSFYVVDSETSNPLSVFEFRDRLLSAAARNTILVVPISESRFGFPSKHAALDYYANGADQFYLWWGNNVFEYDQNTLIQVAGSFSRSLEQIAAILTGAHPEIRIPISARNSDLIRKLAWTKLSILSSSLLFSTALIALALVTVERVRRRRQRFFPRDNKSTTLTM